MRQCFWVCQEHADSLKEERMDRQTQKGIRDSTGHSPWVCRGPRHSLAFPGILHFQQPGADPPLPPTMALARAAARSQDFSPCSG